MGWDTGQELEDSGWSSEVLADGRYSEESVASGILQVCEVEDNLQVWGAGDSLEDWMLLDKWENCCSWSEPGTEVRTSCTGWTGTAACHSSVGSWLGACCPG